MTLPGRVMQQGMERPQGMARRLHFKTSRECVGSQGRLQSLHCLGMGRRAGVGKVECCRSEAIPYPRCVVDCTEKVPRDRSLCPYNSSLAG